MTETLPGELAATSSAARPTVTLLVPMYNEAKHVDRTLATLYSFMESLNDSYDWEILIVDDGSKDDTRARAQAFADSHKGVRLKGHRLNLGLGRALTTGFRNSGSTYIVTCDADLSYAPEHIEDLLDTIVTTEADIVIASPYMEGGSVSGVPRLRALMSRWANRFLGALSLGNLATVTGMVRAYDRRFVRSLSFKAVGTQVNAEIVYKAQILRANIVEIPAHLRWTRDEADTNQRRLHFNLLRTILHFAFAGFIFRPFMFFMLPGLTLLALALYTLGWAVYHVVNNFANGSGSFDPRFSAAVADAFASAPHTFYVGGAAAIIAVQFISLGVVSAQNKRYFEDLYHLTSSTRAD
ncbi:MAG TPA: glycosyltransferase family 2 protein [Acidimicrobiia bacterium]